MNLLKDHVSCLFFLFVYYFITIFNGYFNNYILSIMVYLIHFKHVFPLGFVCKPFTFLEAIHTRHLITQAVRSFDLFDANCNLSPSEQY